MITVQHDGNEYPVNHIKSANRQFPMNDIPELSMIVVNRENNPAYPFLNEEEILVTADGHEWRIKAESEVSHYKNLKAQHILRDLSDMVFNQRLNGIYTSRSLLTVILHDTGFSLDLDDTNLASVQLEDFGRKNVWQCLKEACELLYAEFTVLPGRVIRVSKRLSSDKGKQYRYGYNLKNVTKKTDSTDIVTHVTVNYGEDYAYTATFVSPNAGNYKRAYYGDIINDERITDKETARKRAEAVFKDVDLSYELDIAQIGNDCELGETIHTIYEPLNDLSITTRILKMRDDWDGEQFILTDATVGNYVFKKANQIIQDQIKDSEKSTVEKIEETKEVIHKSMTLKFQETDQKIIDQHTTITSEYTAVINANAQQLRSDYNAKFTTVNGEMATVKNDVSSVIQTASSLQSTVSSQQLTIQSQGTRLLSAESNIIQQANQIAQKVSQTDFNGATITSLINQTPSSVTISASKINLYGAVSVLSDITGNLGSIYAGNIDIASDIKVGDRIWLNGGYGAGLYFDRYGSTGKIYTDGNTMNIYSDAMTISSMYGVDIVNGLRVDGQSVTTSRTDGLGFGYSAASNRLYVSRYGVDVGYIQLT